MAYVSKFVDLDGSGYDLKAVKTAAIPFGHVDGTSTSTKFTATVDGITELYDGVCCYLRNGVVTSAANWTLNINGLGAKPVYSSLANESRTTTIFNSAYTMLFIYNSTRIEGGCWDIFYGYDSNTNTIGYQLRTGSSTRPVSDQCGRYRVLFSSADDTKWVPANTSSSTDATSLETVNQRPINPFGDICYYSYTTILAANATVGTSYQWSQYPFTLGYSFNRKGSALTLTHPAPIYIKCAPQSNGSAIIDADEPYVQALPSTADGKIYIYLGKAYNATSIELAINHPVYEYKDGAIRQYTNAADASVTVTPFVNDGFEIAEINGTRIYSPDVTLTRSDGESIATIGGYDIRAYDSLVIDIGTISDVYYGILKQVTLPDPDYYSNIALGVGSKNLDVRLKATLLSAAVTGESILCKLPYIGKRNMESGYMYMFGGVTASDPSYYPIAVFVGVFGQTAIVLAHKLATAEDLENMSMDFSGRLNDKQDVANLVTSVSSSSTDTQYPSAKLLYDTIGNVESLLAAI